MRSVNDRVDFANVVLAAGHWQGVINVTLGAYLYSPDPAEEDPAKAKIVPDLAITARLRVDVACARMLHAALRDVLAAIDKPAAPPTPPPVASGGIVPEPEEEKGAVH
jgi:hypothetical protein